MHQPKMNTLAALLVAGTALVACQSDPPKTEQEAVKKEAVVITDSAAAAKPDSVGR